MLSKVYINLIGQKEPIFQFKKENGLNDLVSNNTKKYSKKVIKISDQELKSHKQFLKTNLKKNFY